MTVSCAASTAASGAAYEHDEVHLVGRGRDAADGHERRVHRAAAVGHVRRGHHDDVARVGREVAHRAERAVVGALLQGPAAAVLVVGVVDDDLRQRRVAPTHQGVERLDGVLFRGVRAVDALPVVAVHPVGDRLRLLHGVGFDRVAQRLPHQEDQRHARDHQRQSDHGRRRQRGRSAHPGAGPQPPRSQCHATRVTMRDCGGAERTGAPCTDGDAHGRNAARGRRAADPGGRGGAVRQARLPRGEHRRPRRGGRGERARALPALPGQGGPARRDADQHQRAPARRRPGARRRRAATRRRCSSRSSSSRPSSRSASRS